MRKRVLIADDSPYIRRAMRKLVESAGFDVCGEAENGALAVEQADQLQPDLVLLDLSMPVMNGLQAAPLLRKRLPVVPILLFTLYCDRNLEEAALAAGVTSVLSKQEGADGLISTMLALVGSLPKRTA
jgi:DNA-binding NarL/FixJ family response regulator